MPWIWCRLHCLTDLARFFLHFARKNYFCKEKTGKYFPHYRRNIQLRKIPPHATNIMSAAFSDSWAICSPFCKETKSFKDSKDSTIPHDCDKCCGRHPFNAAHIMWQTWNAICFSFNFNFFYKRIFLANRKLLSAKRRNPSACHQFNAGRIV